MGASVNLQQSILKPPLRLVLSDPIELGYNKSILESEKFTVILEPEEGGGYSIHCPALPGCSSQGDSLEEALSNIKEAILGVLKVRYQEGMAFPSETPEIISEEIRQILEGRVEDGLPLIIETREVELLKEAVV